MLLREKCFRLFTRTLCLIPNDPNKVCMTVSKRWPLYPSLQNTSTYEINDNFMNLLKLLTGEPLFKTVHSLIGGGRMQ